MTQPELLPDDPYDFIEWFVRRTEDEAIRADRCFDDFRKRLNQAKGILNTSAAPTAAGDGDIISLLEEKIGPGECLMIANIQGWWRTKFGNDRKYAVKERYSLRSAIDDQLAQIDGKESTQEKAEPINLQGLAGEVAERRGMYSQDVLDVFDDLKDNGYRIVKA